MNIELAWVGGVFVAVMILLALLSREDPMDQRRAVNRLADESKGRKARGMRPRSKYIRAGIQK